MNDHLCEVGLQKWLSSWKQATPKSSVISLMRNITKLGTMFDNSISDLVAQDLRLFVKLMKPAHEEGDGVPADTVAEVSTALKHWKANDFQTGLLAAPLASECFELCSNFAEAVCDEHRRIKYQISLHRSETVRCNSFATNQLKI